MLSLLRSKKKGHTQHSPFPSYDYASVEPSSIVPSGDSENENNSLLLIFSAAS
ncbi:hypothetical protein HOY80DRAFT_1032187 [Tuber brumale]|nr:hypothetical protein HOY80DRAFT_1032187 [Tuber brumale]